jgi:hypothetical protein
MARLLIALFVALGFGLLVSGPVSAQDDPDCEDFLNQEEAQRVLDFDPSDPFDLDRDNNGVACQATTFTGTLTFEDVFPDQAPPAATEPPAEEPTEVPVEEEPTEAPAAPTQAPTTGGGTTLPDTGAGTMGASSSLGLVALFAAFAVVSAGVALRARRI